MPATTSELVEYRYDQPSLPLSVVVPLTDHELPPMVLPPYEYDPPPEYDQSC